MISRRIFSDSYADLLKTRKSLDFCISGMHFQLYIELFENQDAARFFEAETKFNIILADVNKIIGDAVMDVIK